MSGRKAIRPETSLQWLGTVDSGKQLELFTSINGVGCSLLTLVADNSDESLWLEFEAGGHLVQVPAARIAELLDSASKEVRSEAWYKRNVYSKPVNP